MTASINEAKWRAILAEEHRTLLRVLPSEPRCQICNVPFAGFGGALGRLIGFKKWNKNPSLCNRCFAEMPQGGIEIDTAVLFADIRGSTGLAERLGARSFAALLKQYYDIATDVLSPRRAVIDKMIGDEVMALFFPVAGPEYRRVAIESGIALQIAVKEAHWSGEVPRIGVGIYAGEAYVGRIGSEEMNEFTALGDTVNVAARLQSEAEPGQVIIGGNLLSEASRFPKLSERRQITVSGRAQSVDIGIIQT